MTGDPDRRPQLRPYQREAVDRITAEIVMPRRRGLVVGPTGSGKTITAVAAINAAVDRGERVLFVSHRREITHQTCAKLYEAGVRDFGVVQAGFPTRHGARAQIASIQSLHARALRSSTIELPGADIVIIDEGHHAVARTYRQVIAAYPDAAIVGLTATPCRGDGRGLGGIYDVLIEGPQVAELVAQGYLVGTNVFAPYRPDLRGIGVERGDYVVEQLAGVMDRPKLVGDIVENWLRLGERRRTVVFATSVAHSVHIRDCFREAGILAEHLDGSTPIEERDDILVRFAAGRVEVIVNCAVLIEGWDQPQVSCLIVARPTRSMGLFRQMVGRGLRPAPGKSDCIVLDHSGAVYQLGRIEDPIQWTLGPDRHAENTTHRRRGTVGGPPALVSCPECSAVRYEGQPCPACGWRPRPKPQPVPVAAGDLAPVNRDRSVMAVPFTEAQKLQFYRELRGIAAERSTIKNPTGWAAHKFREKFGHFPPFSYRDYWPLPPSPAVRSWERSRRIAFAREMQARQIGGAA